MGSVALRHLPGPGIEPASSALADGFLTTLPPGKSLFGSFFDETSGKRIFGSIVVFYCGTFLYIIGDLDLLNACYSLLPIYLLDCPSLLICGYIFWICILCQMYALFSPSGLVFDSLNDIS